MKTLRNVVLLVAIALFAMAVIPILFPKIVDTIPEIYSCISYLNFVGNVCMTFASLAGFLFLLVAFVDQSIQHEKAETEREIRKQEELLNYYISSFILRRDRIKYLGKTGSEAIKEFYINVKNTVLKSSEPIKSAFRSAIDGSVFTKGDNGDKVANLTLYRKALDNLLDRLVKYELSDPMIVLEANIEEEEKALIFYLLEYYWDEKYENLRYLLENNFFESLNEEVLIRSADISLLQNG